MDGDKMKVSVILCTLDKKRILPEVIPSIKRSPLVDELIVIEGLKPIGYARDVGWRKARNQLICFIDDDEIVPRGWIERLAKEFADLKVGAVSSTVEPLNKSRINFLECMIENHSLKRFSFHARFVRRQALEQIGGYEHTIGGETVYAAWKMVRYGWKARIIDYPLLHEMFDTGYSWMLSVYGSGRVRARELIERNELLLWYRKALGSFLRGFQLSIQNKEPLLFFFYPLRCWLFFLGAIRGSLKAQSDSGSRILTPRAYERMKRMEGFSTQTRN